MPLYDGCIDEGIKIVDVRHEQAAVHAADAWARCNPGSDRRRRDHGRARASPTASPASPTPGARTRRSSCSAARGPSRTCAAARSRRWTTSASMRPITKYADAVYQTQRIPEYIELAIRHAVSGIPGPAYLEIPMDVFMGRGRGGRGADSARSAPRRRASRRIATRCARRSSCCEPPQRPMLMAGTSVKWSRASAEMNRFIAETHIPTYTNGMGRGTVPPDSPEFLNRSRRDALKQHRLHHPGRHAARLPHALRPDDPRRREDHPARHGRDADRPEPADGRRARRQSRMQLRAAARGDEEPGRAARLLGLARRAARDRDGGREEGRGGAQQRRVAGRSAAHVPRGARLARDPRRSRS